MNDRVIYICFGDDCFYLEAAFSILSLFGLNKKFTQKVFVFVDDREKLRQLLGTDAEQYIQIIELPSEQFANFRGQDDYVYRIKPAILDWACHNIFGAEGRILFLDTDTYVSKNIEYLLTSIKKDIWILNDCEGIASSWKRRSKEKDVYYLFNDKNQLTVGQNIYPLKRNCTLWNSGVIGFDLSNADILGEWLGVLDEMKKQLHLRTTEQIALSATLYNRRQALINSSDIIFHYFFFKEFRVDIKSFFNTFVGENFLTKAQLSRQLDPAERIQPLLDFSNQPKRLRSIKKRLGIKWKRLPFPWDEKRPQ